MSQPIKVSIVGASGYSGAELLRILSRHKLVAIDKVFANSSAGKRVDEVYPWFKTTVDLAYEPYSAESACASDVVFIALPSGEAMNIVPGLLERGKKLIDLGGDFRLNDLSLYKKYYKREHASAHLLGRATYGLPELFREHIKTADLIANPGCYPVSAILPLAPLLKENMIEEKGIVVNSLSGVSGAGRSSSLDLSFVEVNESVKAYKVGMHQHIPEIKTALEAATGQHISLTFTPHLIPITRGIYTTSYAFTKKQLSEQDVFGAYEKHYVRETFVRFSSTTIPEVKHVNYTNFIDIGFRIYPENNQIIVISAIDNLVKGAAGQAVQNMNIMFGFAETEGLL